MSSDSTQQPKPAITMTHTSRLKVGASPAPIPAPMPTPAPMPAPATASTVAVDPVTQRETNTSRLRRLATASPDTAATIAVTPIYEPGKSQTDTIKLRLTPAPTPATLAPRPAPVMPAPPPAVAATVSIDPVAQRDTNTSRLRRLAAAGQDVASTTPVTPISDAGKVMTDTVKLRVTREAKKDAPTAQQTIRLRPPPGMEEQSATRPPAASAAGTIRLASPMSSGASPAPAPAPAPAPVNMARQTIRVKPITGAPAPAPAPAPGMEVTADAAETVIMPMPDAAESGSAAQTVRVGAEPTAAPSAKRTLKIRREGAPGGSGDIAPAMEFTPPVSATAAKAAAKAAAMEVGQADTVANTFCVLNILTIGGFIGVLTWQCMKYLWS